MNSRVTRAFGTAGAISALGFGMVVAPPAHAADQTTAESSPLGWVTPQFVQVKEFGRGTVQTDIRLNDPQNPPPGLPTERAYNVVGRSYSVVTPARVEQLIQRGSPRAMPGGGDPSPGLVNGLTYLDNTSALELARSTESYPQGRMGQPTPGYLSYTPITRMAEIRMQVLAFGDQGGGPSQLAASQTAVGQGLVLRDGRLVDVRDVTDYRDIVGDWQRYETEAGLPVRAYVMACKTPYAEFRERTGFDNRVMVKTAPDFESLDPSCVPLGSLATKKEFVTEESSVVSTYVTSAGLPTLLNQANTTSPSLGLVTSGNWIIYTEMAPIGGNYFGVEALKLPRGRVEALPSYNMPKGAFQPTGEAYVIPERDSIAVKWTLAGWQPRIGVFSQDKVPTSTRIEVFMCDGAKLAGWEKDPRVLLMDDATMAKAVRDGTCEPRGNKVIDDPPEGSVDPTRTHEFLTVIPQVERVRPGTVVVARNSSVWSDAKCTLPVACPGDTATSMTSLTPGSQTFYRVGDVSLTGARQISPEELFDLQRRFG